VDTKKIIVKNNKIKIKKNKNKNKNKNERGKIYYFTIIKLVDY
jgi:hypothetical protein